MVALPVVALPVVALPVVALPVVALPVVALPVVVVALPAATVGLPVGGSSVVEPSLPPRFSASTVPIAAIATIGTAIHHFAVDFFSSFAAIPAAELSVVGGPTAGAAIIVGPGTGVGVAGRESWCGMPGRFGRSPGAIGWPLIGGGLVARRAPPSVRVRAPPPPGLVFVGTSRFSSRIASTTVIVAGRLNGSLASIAAIT